MFKARSESLFAIIIAAVVLIPAAGAMAQQFVEEQSTRFPQPAATDYTSQLTFGDIDNDTDLDIIFANGNGFNCPVGAQVLRIYINNGSGVFTDESVARTGGLAFSARGVELGDIERDGDLDIIVANDCNQLPRLLVNTGGGFFTDQTASRLPNITLASSRAQFADVDNDGDLDLYLVNGTTSRFGSGVGKLYLNNGSGVFTDVTATNMPNDPISQPMDCIFGDVDGDLDVDLHVSSRSNGGHLYRNNGNGVFTIAAIPGGATAYSFDFGDLDGDGDLDLLGANAGSGNQEQLLRNNGAGVFTDISSQFIPNPGADDNDSKFFDFDNDGDLDIIIATLPQATASERLYTGSGTGSYIQTSGLITSISDSSLDVKVGDLTGDGRVDIVTGQGESGSFINRIYRNNTGPVDNRAPRIISTEDLPDTSSSAGPYAVRAVVYDDYTSDRGFYDRGVTLNYTINGGATQQAVMRWSGNSVWRGTIPGQPCGSAVSYFVTARDWANNLGTGTPASFNVGNVADLDGNCIVNTLDLGIMLSSWSIPAKAPGCGGAVPCASDLNHDGVVNTLDLGILLAGWTL